LKRKKQQREKQTEQKEERAKEREEEQKKKQEDNITKGAILKLTGLPEGLRIETMKEGFREWGTVNWVDYEKDADFCKVRYDGEGSATAALEKAKEVGEGKIMVNEKEVEGVVLEGDEEKEHWEDFFAQLRRRSQMGHRGGRGGRGGGRGRGRGRGGGRGGKRSFSRGGGRDGPDSKRSRSDD